MIFLSIIVPCYRNKDILKIGIPSLERQSIKDFELILIDDKSPNDLYESMEQYVKSDSCSIKNHIRLYRNETNMGPGATRNRGIELAQGKYILFLDSDDYLKDDAVEVLKNNSLEKEVVLYDFERIVGNRKIMYPCLSNNVKCGTEKDLILEALERANFTTCTKICKRDFLLKKGIYMPNILLGEDYVFSKLLLANCTSISYIHKSIYVMLDNKVSLTKVNPMGEFADEQYEYIKMNWPRNQCDECLIGIFIYLKCFTKVWNLVEHGKEKKCICNYIESLETYGINWQDSEYINRLPIYQRMFLDAVKKKKIVRLKFIVWMRKITKKVYR